MYVHVCFYVEPVSRSKDNLQSWIKSGFVLWLYTYVVECARDAEIIRHYGGGASFFCFLFVYLRIIFDGVMYLICIRLPGDSYF